MDSIFITKSFTITRSELNIILESKKQRGSHNTSDTLRQIIREWKQLQPPAPPKNNHNGTQEGE